MEKIKPQLLEFLPQSSELPFVILAIGTDYLTELRRKFPNGRLFAVVAPESDEADAAEKLCEELDIDLKFLDIYAEPLPFPQDYFDYIIGDLILERAANPQDIAAGFSTFIKPTGAWLTSFRNIRHWSVLKDLMEGHYWNVVSRLYAKQEFERLLYASFYKEARFRPQRRDDKTKLVENLTAAGFSNDLNDLNTEFWLVCAARSMPELALLKSMYDDATRKEFSRILHRIEYDVNAAAETAAFWRLSDERTIFADYAASFVEQTVFHHERFYGQLMKYTDRAHSDALSAIFDAAVRDCINEDRKKRLTELKEKWQETIY